MLVVDWFCFGIYRCSFGIELVLYGYCIGIVAIVSVLHWYWLGIVGIRLCIVLVVDW